MKILIAFFKVPWSEKVLVYKIIMDLAKSRKMVKTRPFRELAAVIGQKGESGSSPDHAQLDYAIRVGRLIRRISPWMPFRAMCFEQALTCSKLLRKKSIPHTIHFGVKKGGEDSHGLEAHAWTTCRHEIVTGKKGHRHYQEVATFSYSVD